MTKLAKFRGKPLFQATKQHLGGFIMLIFKNRDHTSCMFLCKCNQRDDKFSNMFVCNGDAK